jgi:CheY-like chemotaxis protein
MATWARASESVMVVRMKKVTEDTGTKSRRILLVDDVLHVAEALREMLVSLGHEVEIVADGDTALRRYEPGKYDLVITDYSMPGMNGAELTRTIRARSERQLILLMLSPAQSGTSKAARAAQADFLLPKPFSVKEFQEALATLFAQERENV